MIVKNAGIKFSRKEAYRIGIKYLNLVLYRSGGEGTGPDKSSSFKPAKKCGWKRCTPFWPCISL
jgi:hypothetical protein